MAKITPRGGSGWRNVGNSRPIGILVTVKRARHSPDFYACARVKRGPGVDCAYGRNPRVATAAALRALATTISRRKRGAFAGTR